MASSPLPFRFPPTTTSYRAGAIFKFEMCQSAPRHPVYIYIYIYAFYPRCTGIYVFHERFFQQTALINQDSINRLHCIGKGDTDWTIRDSNLLRSSRFFSCPKRPNPLWVPPSLLINEYRFYFLGNDRPGRGDNHLCPPSSEVKNE